MLLDIKTPDLEKVRRQLVGMEDEAETVMQKAINKTIVYIQKQVALEAKQTYIVKAPAVKKTLSIYRAKKSNLSGSVVSRSSKKIPLYGFKVSPKSRMPDPPEFYESQVKKASGLKSLPGSSDRSKAFVATMSSGHTGIFQRQLKGSDILSRAIDKARKKAKMEREPIAELFSLSVPSILKTKIVSKEIRSKGQKFLHERLDAEIKSMLGAMR